VLAKNSALKPPLSKSFASSIQYSSFRLVADLSLGFCLEYKLPSLAGASRRGRTCLPLAWAEVADRNHVKGIYFIQESANFCIKYTAHGICVPAQAIRDCQKTKITTRSDRRLQKICLLPFPSTSPFVLVFWFAMAEYMLCRNNVGLLT
jgi:hypothetical protein